MKNKIEINKKTFNTIINVLFVIGYIIGGYTTYRVFYVEDVVRITSALQWLASGVIALWFVMNILLLVSGIDYVGTYVNKFFKDNFKWK